MPTTSRCFIWYLKHSRKCTPHYTIGLGLKRHRRMQSSTLRDLAFNHQVQADKLLRHLGRLVCVQVLKDPLVRCLYIIRP